MSFSRRKFLAGSLGLTLGGCISKVTKNETSENNPDSARTPSSSANSAGFRFSSPLENLKPHYQTVVVGSGYGASVIAHRLSSKFSDMCILERGKEWHPGSFPETLPQLAASFRERFNPLGLIDITPGKDIDIICGSGLGGTSLINAAISIRPEMNVFQQPQWPEPIRQAAANGDLERYYQKAEAMLKPQNQRQSEFSKTRLHRRAATEANRPWGELNLNIQTQDFNKSNNSLGYPQSACTSCGNCCTGCNIGAKNTLLTNYLFLAAKQGVKIFTQVEVESIEKVDKQLYRLNLKIHHLLGFHHRTQITANHVFLGAGSKGSTEILMRSQSDNFRFSQTLGTRLSANGDVMGMSYNGSQQTNILAKGKDRPGVIIASYANYRNPSPQGDVDSQFLLLDGVVPSALSSTVAQGMAHYVWRSKDKFYPPGSTTSEAFKRIRADIDSFDPTETGALNHSMLYFACGHDSSGGRYVYDKKKKTFDYVWADVLDEPTFQRINNVMADYTKNNDGVFIPNPRSTIFGHKIQVTHPLGGCPMGEDVRTGVVNHLGKVFSHDGEFHENLYVVDAAIIPRSLSATPLLTITALAERIADNF